MKQTKRELAVLVAIFAVAALTVNMGRVSAKSSLSDEWQPLQSPWSEDFGERWTGSKFSMDGFQLGSRLPAQLVATSVGPWPKIEGTNVRVATHADYILGLSGGALELDGEIILRPGASLAECEAVLGPSNLCTDGSCHPAWSLGRGQTLRWETVDEDSRPTLSLTGYPHYHEILGLGSR